MTTPTYRVAQAVRISRDEAKYPSKGTWSRHRGKAAFVVMVNSSEDTDPPEYGVIETTTRPQFRREPGREHEVYYDSDAVLWFGEHELKARSEA